MSFGAIGCCGKSDELSFLVLLSVLLLSVNASLPEFDVFDDMALILMRLAVNSALIVLVAVDWIASKVEVPNVSLMFELFEAMDDDCIATEILLECSSLSWLLTVDGIWLSSS